MGPMGGPMDFGKNKSKFQEVPETGITFDDVAVGALPCSSPAAWLSGCVWRAASQAAHLWGSFRTSSSWPGLYWEARAGQQAPCCHQNISVGTMPDLLANS